MPNKFAEVLNLLANDVEDVYKGEERISGFSSFILDNNFNFSFNPNSSDNNLKYLDKGKRLVYNFYTGNIVHYISLSYQEYFTLIQASENKEIISLSPVSIIEMTNLYMYFKMQAYIYSNVYRQEYGRDFKPEDIKINNSNETIGKFIGVGARTVTMYANALEKIGLIDIGKEKNNKVSGFKYVYKLSGRYLEG